MAFQVGATGITLMERALGGTPTSTSATSSSTDSPFFPDPSSLVPPTSTSNSGHKQTLSKSILEWVFFVTALVLITTFLTCRSWQLRRRNRPFSQFFAISQTNRPSVGRPSQIPRTTGLPTINEPLRPVSLTREMLYPDLFPMPAAYRSRGRRTRAADTDEGGRRAGGPEDHKDMLPAYDNVGGPPKYVEMDVDPETLLHLNLSDALERERSRDIPDVERNTPVQSTEEVASSSHSHHARRASAQSQPEHQQPELEAPHTPDPLAANHPS